MTVVIIVAIICITIVFLAWLGYRSKENTILEMYERYLEEVEKRTEKGEDKNDE